MQTRLPAGLTNGNIATMAACTPGGWVRITQDFATMAPTASGVTSWAYETQVDYALSLGMRVMLCLTYAPSWMGVQYHQIPQTTTQRNQWAALAAEVVNHYEGRAGSGADPQISYELWNEPNHGPFSFSPSMSLMRPFFRATVLAMRAADSDCFIITGGPASATSKVGEYTTRWDQDASAPAVTPTGTMYNTGNGGGSISIATFLDGLFAPPGVAEDGTGLNAGTSGAWVNAYGIHAYTGTYSPLTQHFGMPIWHAFSDVSGHGSSAYNYWDDIIVAREGAPDANGKTIWATEQGVHGGAPTFTETQAADALDVALARWWGAQGEGKAGPYIYFELFDHKAYGDPTSTSNEDYLGMYRKDALLPKPQMTSWQAFTMPGDPPPPTNPDTTYDVVRLPDRRGTPRGERARVPVRGYTARAYD